LLPPSNRSIDENSDQAFDHFIVAVDSYLEDVEATWAEPKLSLKRLMRAEEELQRAFRGELQEAMDRMKRRVNDVLQEGVKWERQIKSSLDALLDDYERRKNQPPKPKGD